MPPTDIDPGRDERWFEDLYRTHHGAVLAYARRRVDDPDDVVAEVFAAAWRARSRVPEPALPWLFRTASNHVLHAGRSSGRRRRLTTRAAGLAAPSPDHADSVARRLDAAHLVTAALHRLSPADQELLRLVAWEDLTHDEIAYVLGCTAGAVRVRLHRARGRLATAVGQDLGPVRPHTQETRT